MRRPASGDHFFLELYWAEESVVVPISETYMRQLLTLLHRSYHAAGWSPKGAWPVWLGEEAHRTVLDSSEIN